MVIFTFRNEFKFTLNSAVQDLLSEGVAKNSVVDDVDSWDQKSNVLSPNFYEFLNEFWVIFNLLV